VLKKSQLLVLVSRNGVKFDLLIAALTLTVNGSCSWLWLATIASWIECV